MSNDLVPITDTLTALADVQNLRTVVAENLGGQGMSAFDLQRIKVASGGAPSFVVADALTGDTMLSRFDAVVVVKQSPRAYWKSNDPSGDPPDCSSHDSITGEGDNGYGSDVRPCSECPMSKFGSAVLEGGEVGKGQACKQTARLFVLRMDQRDSVFPSVLTCPPSSLKGLHKYLAALTGQAVPYWAALHSFEVVPEKSERGHKFGRVKLGFVRRLDAGEIAAVKGYREAIAGALVQRTPPAAEELRD